MWELPSELLELDRVELEALRAVFRKLPGMTIPGTTSLKE
jgi:hypothetical protein